MIYVSFAEIFCVKAVEGFLDAGYDDIEYLLGLAGKQAQDEEMQSLAAHVGLKPGHTARFLATLRNRAAAQGGHRE